MFGWLKKGRAIRRPLPSELAADRLVAILRAYHDLAGTHAADFRASALLDEDRLPYPKEVILDAICVYLYLQADPARADAVAALAATLASFQAGVGTEILLPKDESLRRRVIGPIQAKDFSDIYARVDDDAERYAALHGRMQAELAAIQERCGQARAGGPEPAVRDDAVRTA